MTSSDIVSFRCVFKMPHRLWYGVFSRSCACQDKSSLRAQIQMYTFSRYSPLRCILNIRSTSFSIPWIVPELVGIRTIQCRFENVFRINNHDNHRQIVFIIIIYLFLETLRYLTFSPDYHVCENKKHAEIQMKKKKMGAESEEVVDRLHKWSDKMMTKTRDVKIVILAAEIVLMNWE